MDTTLEVLDAAGEIKEKVKIKIKKITGSGGVNIFNARACVIYNECKRDIPRLNGVVAQWAEVLTEVSKLSGLAEDSKQLAELISGYNQAKSAVKSAEEEQKKAGLQVKKILGALPEENDEGIPDHLMPYAMIASEVCGSYLVVEYVTGRKLTDADSVFASSDPDSFYSMCQKIKEVNSRFLSNSLFRTAEDQKTKN